MRDGFVVLFYGGGLLFKSNNKKNIITIIVGLSVIVTTWIEIDFFNRLLNTPNPDFPTLFHQIIITQLINIMYILLILITSRIIVLFYPHNQETDNKSQASLPLYISKPDNSVSQSDDLLLISSEDKLENLLNETVISLAKAIDARDPYTCFHSGRVAKYSYHIANKMGLVNEARNIMIGAQLHDIGKISIPEYILTKPDRLTESEEQIMRQHPTNGYEIISAINELSSRGVHDIILYHHERYDGLGYPFGLSGTEIPLSARIVSVADSFDAMTTKRSYKNSMSKTAAIHELLKHSNTQFDSNVVKIFLECLEENPDLFENPTENQKIWLQEERGLRSLA